MDVIIDANVIIAALISPAGHTADIFFSPLLSIFAPELLLEEVKEHKKELMLKTNLSGSDFEKALAFLTKEIILFPAIEFLPFLPKAKQISPDQDDIAYLALALKLRCPLWSNDKALKLQSEVKVFSTSELLQFLV